MMDTSIRAYKPLVRNFVVERGLAGIVFVKSRDQWSDRAVAHECDFLLFFWFHDLSTSFYQEDTREYGNCRVRLCW